jgi:UDP-N-acetylglucosamine--N-acetylmuramyl-(pentapeptide) pyrophosphoryl-undecaprenol N-acetylglucosamine transferase
MRYILTGGGSGGHIYPALAIAGKIKQEEPDAEFLYLGTKKRLEAWIVPAKGYPIKFIKAAPLPVKKLRPSSLIFLFVLFWGILKSALIIYRYKPEMVIGTGGFVSAPVVLAAAFLRRFRLSKTKIFLHEANAEPGAMIKACGKYCDGVGTAYKSCLRYFAKNGKFVGFPVRNEFFTGDKTESRIQLGIAQDAFVVFAFGASQGARTINRAVVDCLPHLKNLKNLVFIHGTGRNSASYTAEEDTRDRFVGNNTDERGFTFYKRYAYLDNIKDYFYASDLVITRAGAGSLTEIAVCKKPSIIIPKANLSGDHQVVNAEYVREHKAADIIYEEVLLEKDCFREKVAGERLAQAIIDLSQRPDRLAEMSDACKELVLGDGLTSIYHFIRDIKEGEHKADKYQKDFSIGNPYTNYSPLALENRLSKMTKEEVLASPHLDYLRYRCSHYFTSALWQRRNYGVKLAGLTYDQARIPFLTRLFNDRRPVRWTKKLLGGDFIQVGFIRRNIIIAYTKIGVFNPEIEADLMLGLQDPYFETVSESAKAVRQFYDKINNKKIFKNELLHLLKNKNQDVLGEVIVSLGLFIESYEEFAVLEKFYFLENWKIRQAVLTALLGLKSKNILADKQQNKQILDKMLLTATGFVPEFEFKKLLKEIAT